MTHVWFCFFYHCDHLMMVWFVVCTNVRNINSSKDILLSTFTFPKTLHCQYFVPSLSRCVVLVELSLEVLVVRFFCSHYLWEKRSCNCAQRPKTEARYRFCCWRGVGGGRTCSELVSVELLHRKQIGYVTVYDWADRFLHCTAKRRALPQPSSHFRVPGGQEHYIIFEIKARLTSQGFVDWPQQAAQMLKLAAWNDHWAARIAPWSEPDARLFLDIKGVCSPGLPGLF